MDQTITDEMIINATRQKILDEIKRREDARNVINNIVGGSGMNQASDVMTRLGNNNQGFYEEDSDIPDVPYAVDIEKRDIFPEKAQEMEALAAFLEQHPEEMERIGISAKDLNIGKPVGWKKRVMRHKGVPEKDEPKGKK